MKNIFYFLVVLYGCSGMADEPTIERINADKLVELQTKGVSVIDIRTPKEYVNGHIPGAIPLDFLGDNFLDGLENQDKSKPVIIHCASGGRSARAAKMMKEAGFRKIYDYSGGFTDWKLKGLDIEK